MRRTTTAVLALTILTGLLGGSHAAAQTCDPALCFTPTTSAYQPMTSPAEIPVVVEAPPDLEQREVGVLRAADGPTAFSLGALIAGASTVLLTLFALVRNRRAFLANAGEPEPVEMLAPAKSSRTRDLVAQTGHVRQSAFVRSDR